ncbi:MAG: hypothetical protein U1C55_11740, partial [Smithellaceae bacterium]|nr:hypothetical protein [Smithellaceae bacterium]
LIPVGLIELLCGVFMKKLKIRIQCKCQSCGKVWMDNRQWVFCMLCQADGTADKWKRDFLSSPEHLSSDA